MSAPRLVLVTGSPRSGTTPVGDLLALAAGARSLYEPLNAHVGDRRIRRYFEVPGHDGFGDDDVAALLADIARPRLRLRPGLFPEDRGWRRLAKRVTGSRTTMTYRQCRLDPRLRTIVWKDPFATFLVRDVAAAGVPVVATVRPPHAVAASFTRLDWRFDVADLARRLGRGMPVATGLVPDRPAHNAAVLWHLVYGHLLDAARATPAVRLLDVDRLVEDPVGQASVLYEHMGLEWTQRVARDVEQRYRSSDGPAAPTGDRAHGGCRDLREVNRYWRGVLTDADVAVVDELDAELWSEVQRAATS